MYGMVAFKIPVFDASLFKNVTYKAVYLVGHGMTEKIQIKCFV